MTVVVGAATAVGTWRAIDAGSYLASYATALIDLIAGAWTIWTTRSKVGGMAVLSRFAAGALIAMSVLLVWLGLVLMATSQLTIPPFTVP